MQTQTLLPPFEIMPPKRPTRRFTLEEYLAKEAKSAEKHEFIDGKIIKMPYAKGPHNIIAANVARQIGNATENLPTNFIVFGSDQKIYFPSIGDGAYADALAVAVKPIYWDSEKLLLINPTLIVEVLSKSTSKYDRTGKFDKYKTLESFREYVLIRQDQCYAEVWFRERPGFWHETIVENLDGSLPLQSLGVSISMERVYRNVEF